MAAVVEAYAMAVSRDKLYEEVWSEPMTIVAARYGVSSSFLARVCKRLNVPRPPRGYWAKLKVGKVDLGERPMLPAVRAGDELEWRSDAKPGHLPRSPSQKAAATARQRRNSHTHRPNQHILLTGAREYFDAARVLDGGYLKPSKRLLVDVLVSQDSLVRALDAANQLFLSLENRGYFVVIAPRDGHYQRPSLDLRENSGGKQYFENMWSPDRPTVAWVGNVAIGLTLFELSEEVEVQWADGKYIRVTPASPIKRRPSFPTHVWTHTRNMPNGRLGLRAYSPYPRTSWEKQWHETRAGELPNKFDEIGRELKPAAVTITKLVDQAKEQAELERQKWEEQQREWRRKEAERHRLQAHKDSRDQLLSLVETWALACRIESFLESIATGASQLEGQERDAVLERLELARQMFGGTDTLQHFRSWKSPDER